MKDSLVIILFVFLAIIVTGFLVPLLLIGSVVLVLLALGSKV
jgi:hypothetical protein